MDGKRIGIDFRLFKKDIKDSLESTRTVYTLGQIRDIVNCVYFPFDMQVSDLRLEFAEDEYVEGWDSYAVKAKFNKKGKYLTVGFTNGKWD